MSAAVRPPAPEDLLSAWDAGLREPPAARALLLLRAAGVLAAEDLRLGERERLLLELRRALFGSRLACLAECPDCGAELQATLTVEEILLPRRSEAPAPVRHRGREFALRAPSAGDLARAARIDDPAQRRRAVLAACLEAEDAGDLPAAVLRRIERRLVDADPQAAVELALRCPDCSRAWDGPFDAATHVWAEVDAWARRLLHDIHELALAYGWTESEVIALAPARRAFYLEAVRA